MFPPSRMAESSEAISAFAPSFCRRFVWSPWRSRRHDVIPPRDRSLTHCGFCGNIPSWLVHDCVHECSLGEDKSVLARLLSGPNQTWFSNSGEQDPIQMLVYLSAASLPPSEGVLLHSGLRARWTNLVWSKKTNLHPDTYVGFIYTRTVSSSCGPPEHQRGLCVLN